MELTKPKKETLTDKVHDAILELIIKNVSQDEIVFNESQLMEVFGVSKAPVREALIRLCSEGVLKTIPRYGYVVVRLTEKDEKDVIQMRILLETEALKTNFDYIVPYRLNEIKEQIERSHVGGTMDVWQLWKLNEEFHLMLASYGNNQILTRFLLESLQIHKRIYAKRWWKDQNTMEINSDSAPHLEIYRALKDGDLEAGMRALKRDIASHSIV